MSASPTPQPQSVASSGVPDSQFITDVRRSLGDQPIWLREQQSGDGTNGVNSAAAVPFRVGRPPIYDNTTSNTPLYVTVGGTSQTVISTGTPGTNQVLVNYENGELTFGAAPASGTNNVLWAYQKVKWTDQAILNALMAGLRAMFPKVGKEYVDTSVTIQVVKWDYQVPVWAQSPGSEIYGVEVQPAGISVVPFRPLAAPDWDRIGVNTLHIPESQMYPPNSILRITGRGPYLKLGDLEPQLYELPILYACFSLLAKEEAVRLRDDRMAAASSEGAHAPGQMTNTSGFYKKMFDQELDKVRRVGGGWRKKFITVYQRRRYVGGGV